MDCRTTITVASRLPQGRGDIAELFRDAGRATEAAKHLRGSFAIALV